MGFCAWNQCFPSCLYGALPEGTFLTSRESVFLLFFFCLFVFFPESIGSDGEQVVDALW